MRSRCADRRELARGIGGRPLAPGILSAEDEGSFIPSAAGPSPFVTRVHVVGGTGSYQDATGSITR